LLGSGRIGATHARNREERMALRFILAAVLAFAVSGCGVKTDLMTPEGKTTPRSQRDPSRPPQPIGQ
jgi:predicted small lipoprotein YifL